MAPRYELTDYRPLTANRRSDPILLLQLRSVNPLYGVYVANHLVVADAVERIQALESVLELPANIARLVRVPPPGHTSAGATCYRASSRPVVGAWFGYGVRDHRSARKRRRRGARFGSLRHRSSSTVRRMFDEPPPMPLALGEKIRRLFDYDFPRVHDVSYAERMGCRRVA